MERLTERKKDGTWYKNCEGCPSPDYGFYCTDCEETVKQRDKLADYEDAEEENRLFKMPVKVDNMAYVIIEDGKDIRDSMISYNRIIGYDYDFRGMRVCIEVELVDDGTTGEWVDASNVFATFKEADDEREKRKDNARRVSIAIIDSDLSNGKDENTEPVFKPEYKLQED